MIQPHALPLLVLAALLAACGPSTGNGTTTSSGGSAGSGGSGSGGSGSGGSGSGGSGMGGSGSGLPDGGSPDSGLPDSGLPDGGDGGSTGIAGLPVNLGKAGEYVILAQSAIATVPISAITGNLGISPAAASFITGFSLSADATNVFSTSPQVTGKVYAANYAVPTPSNLTTAVGDMLLAFSDAAGRAPDVTELGAGNIGGMTLPAGVYRWGTGLLIPTDVTLQGNGTDVWIFQIAQSLTMSSATHVVLTGGALPKNVFWQVAGLVDVGTTAHLEGVVLTLTSATLHSGASLDGRLLAQTAVNLAGNAIVAPAP
jgi:hypothetical protein